MRRSFGPPLQGGTGFWGGVSQGVALGWVWGRPLAFGQGSHTQWGRFMGNVPSSLKRDGLESGENALHNFAGDICEAVIASRVSVREPFVVEAEQVQDRGMKIMYMDAVASHANAVLVRLPVDGASPDSSSGQPG